MAQCLFTLNLEGKWNECLSQALEKNVLRLVGVHSYNLALVVYLALLLVLTDGSAGG